MNSRRTMTVVIAASFACGISVLCTAADTGDRVDPASVAAPSPGSIALDESDEKTGNPEPQSKEVKNPVADSAQSATTEQLAADAPEPAALVKPKTKSNQSNDRVGSPTATSLPEQPVTGDAEATEVLKTKTKSNQSND